MTLSEVKTALQNTPSVRFELPDGEFVAPHFHVTEVGKLDKHFIDCGGTVRHELRVAFQLWEANDYDHRLHPVKLLNIISLSEEKLQLGDWEVEVEYQGRSIEKFALDFAGDRFRLLAKETDCLAKGRCGLPEEKTIKSLRDLTASTCAPGSACC